MPIRYVSGDLFDNTHDARAFARAGRHVEGRKGLRIPLTSSDGDAVSHGINFCAVDVHDGCFSKVSPDRIVLKAKTWPTRRALLSGSEIRRDAVDDEVRQAKSVMIAARDATHTQAAVPQGLGSGRGTGSWTRRSSPSSPSTKSGREALHSSANATIEEDAENDR